MFSNPFSKLFKARAVIEAETERDETIVEEEIQAAARNVEAIMEDRAERLNRIKNDAKLKDIFTELNKSRRGRDGQKKA
jgi:nitrate/TMAO reductase-like tetraheme cytochrome c subunit